jgi:putative hydrolase of HD superfamily
MRRIADFLFEARMLKNIERSGFRFLGAGKESVAEHSWMITIIAFALARLQPEVDAGRLIAMCLVHDLPEARIGDLNYVQKQYVSSDEAKAIVDMTRDLPFGGDLAELLKEFDNAETLEAQLAKDADQLALLLELKAIGDGGCDAPDKWIPFVMQRLKTPAGKQLAENILATGCNDWWMNTYEE